MGRRKKAIRAWWQVLRHIGALLQDREGRTKLMLYAGVALTFFAAAGILDRTLISPDEITPHEARFGWNETIAAKEAPAVAALMPKFAIRDADGNVLNGEGKSAELWKFAKIANEGRHIPTWRQQSGDCVSMGNSNAVAYRQAFQIAKEGRRETLKIPFPPHNYGASRVLVGRRQLGRGAGSIGAWGAQASIAYGVLPVDEAGRIGFVYSGRLADEWGWNGPPKSTLEFSKSYRIKTVSQVKTWDDLRDALVFGYPVTVASNVGFDGGSYDRDGKRWLRPRGSWPHQMCFIGAEDRPGRVKGAYVINSWGADAHPKPLNDEPPGGFWVDHQTAHGMVGQGDSWAYSDFDGFPATDDAGADWTAFKSSAEWQPEDAELVARAETPEPQRVILETRKMFSLPLLAILLVAGIALFSIGLYRTYGPSKLPGTVGALLIAAAIIGIGDRAAEAGRRHRMMWRQQTVSSSVCVNGQCPTGYVRPEGKPRDPNAGLLPELRGPSKPEPVTPGVQVASNEKVPADIFQAFGPMETVSHGWTSFGPPDKTLRTYADCFSREKDFVLVVGKETVALDELQRTDKPVAYEVAHKAIKPGAYRVFEQGGRLAILPIVEQHERNISAIGVRRQQ